MSRFSSGWFKFYRESYEKDLSQNVYLWAIWCALLNMATWKETQLLWKGKQRMLPPGSVVLGIREISEKFECSRQTIIKWIKYLTDTGRIVTETCNRGTIVTICNWNIYQSNEDVDQNERLQPSYSQVTTKLQPSYSQVTLSEELRREEDKKEELKTIVDSSKAESLDRAIALSRFDFDKIYQEFPRKEGKAAGLAICKRTIRSQERYDQLMTAVRRYRKECEDRGTEGKYIQLFSTFMGKDRWTDWLDPETGSTSVSTNQCFDINKIMEKRKI